MIKDWIKALQNRITGKKQQPPEPVELIWDLFDDLEEEKKPEPAPQSPPEQPTSEPESAPKQPEPAAESNPEQPEPPWKRYVRQKEGPDHPPQNRETEPAPKQEEDPNRDRLFACKDDNMDALRADYPQGLHFVVGDTHCQRATVEALMKKIQFDPGKDHVYFLGDYNGGGDCRNLMGYLARYYEPDLEKPGFHMIRGNHERELSEWYPLENLPDVILLKREKRNYYLAHAGMVRKAMDLIAWDGEKLPVGAARAYRLDGQTTVRNAPLREVTWSQSGLYSQSGYRKLWPSEQSLRENRACIIHGHTPYCYLMRDNIFSYGDRNLFWTKQHIWFSEDLQSFNVDSNVKGVKRSGESYRGLACLCLEALEETLGAEDEGFTVEKIRQGRNFAFSSRLRGLSTEPWEEPTAILRARPEMKTITLWQGEPCFRPE